jgi:hypothetical protein
MMKELIREWQSIVRGVQAVTQKAEKIVERLDNLEKAQGGQRLKVKTKTRKRRVPVIKAPDKASIDTVMDIIKGSVKGVDIGELKEKTGLGEREIRSIVFGLRREGKIKRLFVSK